MFAEGCLSFPGKHVRTGRYTSVTIEKGSESKTMKYKKAESLLEDGWTLVGQ